MFSIIPFCTVGSLALGLTAWALPLIALGRKQRGMAWQPLSVFSMLLGALALQLQLEAAGSWARGEDVAALLDCCSAQAFAGRCLLFGVMLLNAVLWLSGKKRKGDAE